MEKKTTSRRAAAAVLAALAALVAAIALARWCPSLLPSALQPAPTPTATPLPFAPPWTRGQLEVHIIDVDHGDAQLIVSPTGETMLIDCARVEYAPKVARYIQAVLGRVEVDYLVMTHYDIDHDAGCAPLLRDHKLVVRRAVFDRGGGRSEVNSDDYHSYFDAVTDPALGLNRVRVRVGQDIDMGGRLSVRVLSVGDIDARTALGVRIVGENDNSIVLWISMGDLDYWTGGDLSGENTMNYANIEAAVIPLLPRQADVLRANHHASRYNNHLAFLDALRPTATMVSAVSSVTNFYTLYRIKTFGDVYCTGIVTGCDAYGDIVMTSRDGKTYTIEGKTYTTK